MLADTRQPNVSVSEEGYSYQQNTQHSKAGDAKLHKDTCGQVQHQSDSSSDTEAQGEVTSQFQLPSHCTNDEEIYDEEQVDCHANITQLQYDLTVCQQSQRLDWLVQCLQQQLIESKTSRTCLGEWININVTDTY